MARSGVAAVSALTFHFRFAAFSRRPLHKKRERSLLHKQSKAQIRTAVAANSIAINRDIGITVVRLVRAPG